MANIITRLISAGQQDTLPDHINASIKISNIAGIVFGLLMGLPFIFISEMYTPQVTIIPLLGMLSFFSVIILNRLHLQYFSRAFLSVAPILIAAIFQGALLQAGEKPLPAMFLVELSLVVVVFLVHDWKERTTILVLSFINLFILFLHNPINSWIEIDPPLDHSAYEDGTIYYGCITQAIVTILSIISAQIARSSAAIGRKNLQLTSTKTEVEQLNGKVKELQTKLEELHTAQENERSRQWANTGIAQLNEIFRSKKTAKEIYDDTVSFLVKYTEANQGGIFVAQENDTRDPLEVPLELKAAYAYNKKKYITKTVKAGESLLGQVFLEGKPYLLSEIPNGYLEVTSGLGEATPKFVSILPVMEEEGKVEGVLELATFEAFSEAHLLFLEQACKNLASYVFGQRWEEESARMLEASQLQEDKFRQKEDNLRERESQYLEQIRELREALDVLHEKTMPLGS